MGETNKFLKDSRTNLPSIAHLTAYLGMVSFIVVLTVVIVITVHAYFVRGVQVDYTWLISFGSGGALSGAINYGMKTYANSKLPLPEPTDVVPENEQREQDLSL